jgi:PAS domain S-box-containing protein
MCAMKDKTRDQLIAENEELRSRVSALEASETEWRRTEEALQESEERFRLLVEAIPQPIWRSDADGNVIEFNRRWYEYTGQTAGDAKGSGWAKAVHSDEAAMVVQKVRAGITSGVAIEIVNRLRRASDGSYRWHLARAVPMNDRGGKIIGWFGCATDIDDQKRAEEALREREAQLLEAQEVAKLGFHVVDLTTGCIRTSAVLNRIFGIPVDYERTLDKWAELIHPDERQEIVDYFQEVVGQKKPFDREYRIIRYEDKEVRWVHGLGRLQFNEEGRPVSMLGTIQDITARKRAEKDLAKSKAMLQAAIDCLPFNFFAMGLDGRYMLQNAVCKTQQRADVIGKLPEEVCPNEHDLAIWLDNNRRAFAGEKVEGQVTLSLGGEERFYYNVIAPIQDTGELYGILGVNIDITEHKRAEEALQKAHDELERRVEERTAELSKANERLKWEVEERQRAEEGLRQSELQFRNYFEQGLIGMAVTSLDKRWLLVNDRLCEILGYSREELCQKTWPELTHPDDVETNLQLFNRLLAGEIQHFTLDKRFVKKDRSLVYATIHIRAFHADDGSIDHIVALTEDITARKQAEGALHESEERYRTLIDTSPDAVMMLDLDGHITFVSRRALELYGAEHVEELLGKNPLEFFAPEDQQKFLTNLQRTLEVGITRDVEYTFLRRDGSRLAGEGSAAVIRGMSGKPTGCVATVRDITERRQAQEALERERQTLWHMLQASDYERRLIAYDIHDGLAQYLAAAGMQFQAHDSLRKNSPNKARKAYETAVELVRQAHAESRRLISEVRPPVIDEDGLETAIPHLVHEQRRHGGPKIEKIELHSDVQFGRLPSILENAIYRIVQEALTNACKHSKSKKVTVTMTQEGQDVRLEVRDWGIGFDPESVEKGHFGLEGIRQRVRLLGGRLTIESKPGSGTLVQVVVPIVEKQNGE